jgi:hypothetical protein
VWGYLPALRLAVFTSPDVSVASIVVMRSLCRGPGISRKNELLVITVDEIALEGEPLQSVILTRERHTEG